VEGDAHVIRNAGGLARDALRSLVISQHLLGTREVVILHHTECGMLTFQNEDLEESVRDDIRFLKESPLIPDDASIRGFVYDVKTGRVREV
jgi:carbonic anhydrase